MASHHRRCCCRHPSPPPPTACCCSSSHCYTQQHHYLPPPQPTDPLLQTIVSLLEQNQLQRQQQSVPIYPPNPHIFQNPHHQKQHFQQKKSCLKQRELNSQTQSIILSSITDRIDVLESSLHQFFTSGFRHPPSSVRDAAARVIQAHFRAFLVRRSRTLRQLKELAFIKSSFDSLKSSVSNETRFNVANVYQQAMDLLLKLDSVQDGDPMIRDGKKSVSREFVRFLDFIDGFVVKRHLVSLESRKGVKLVHKGTKSSKLGKPNSMNIESGKKEIIDNLRERIEKIRDFTRICENDEEEVEFEGFRQIIDEDDDDHYNRNSRLNGKSRIPQTGKGILILRNENQPRVRKSVGFADNGSFSRVFSNACEPISGGVEISIDGSASSDDDEVENEFDDSKGFFKDDKNNNAHLKNGGSPVGNGGVNITFSAPEPVKMESRTDLFNKKKGGK